MSPLLERFFASLPPAHFLDGPAPDLNLVVDVLMDVDAFVPDWGDGPPAGPHPGQQQYQQQGPHHDEYGGHAGGGGMKREFDAGPGADDDMMGGGGPGRDVYRMRAKQKARLGGD
jgi:hypothetical protein